MADEVAPVVAKPKATKAKAAPKKVKATGLAQEWARVLKATTMCGSCRASLCGCS